MRWKRKQQSREQAKASYSAVHPDVDLSLLELHQRAGGPPDWRDDPRNFSDYGELPGDLVDDVDDDVEDDDVPAWGPQASEFDEARDQLRQQLDADLKPFAYMIQSSYAGDAKLAAQRDPRIARIVTPFLASMKLIDDAERKYQHADAVEEASKPWAVAERRDRARGVQATIDFGRDLGKPSRLVGPASGPGRSTDDMAVGFGQPSGVFGTDSDMFSKSALAQGISGTVYSSDGFRW